MPSPFPGMDPWLEHPSVWLSFHNRFIAAIADDLGPRLRPRYYVDIDERTYVDDGFAFVGRPDGGVVDLRGDPSPAPPATSSAPAVTGGTTVTVDVSVPDVVRESYLEVRLTETHDVVTVIELLSPANKLRRSNGRRLYERKRRIVLGSLTSLVEIDLVRTGEPMEVGGADPRSAAYRLLISRGDHRPTASLTLFGVRDAIPRFRLPLGPGEQAAEPDVDLGAILARLYDVAGYDLRIDYRRDPAPPLSPEDAAWADALLRDAAKR